ncbi:MAG: hypothetical protein RMX68_007470 [Aulosira sp. ZfuVER01]|nr:hypothetical protein [Aulosira sp. ZfuVER01]MDZ7999469.1 hypothetical protein [Aulosira sp. DedVER01a]MDZ8054751.1 hypothetical protein [Aulosira sp. ZfuCHP01]
MHKPLSTHTIRLSAVLSALSISVFTSATTAAPAPIQRIAHIGSINGTLSWRKGEIFVPSGTIAAPGIKSPTLQDQINLHAYIIKVIPGSDGSFGTVQRTQVGSEPKYGRAIASGDIVSVQYTVTAVPIGTAIQINTKDSLFSPIGAANVICTVEAPVVSNYDLRYQEPPR